MSAARVLGMARSLAIYHGVPFRQRRMRHLYREFVSAGDLVIDVGAHAGGRTRAFAALGCRVLAVEPQPDFVRLLRLLFARTPAVTVLPCAVSDTPGRVSLAISERTPTVTTIADDWRALRAQEPGFAGVAWNSVREVDAVTLDQLAATYGRPSFVKIDVEGAESAVLAGASQPLPALSFEYLPNALDQVRRCVAMLEARGSYVYNWSPGESYRLAAGTWVSGADLLQALAADPRARQSGDVYAVSLDGRRPLPAAPRSPRSPRSG